MPSLKNKKMFKVIGYVSPVAFNFLALFTGGSWIPFIGGACGAFANIFADKDSKNALIEQYEMCVEKALNIAKSKTHNGDWIDILNELSAEEGVHENLDDLIKKSDCFRSRYCTPKDAKEIIKLFEDSFLKEVATCQQLNNFYTLNNSRITLEKLKDIYNIMNDNSEKINVMSAEVSKLGKAYDKCESFVKNLFQRVGNALIAFCGFILLGLVFTSSTTYDNSLIILLSFIIGEMIVEYTYERFNYFIFKNRTLTNMSEGLCKILMQTAIVVSLTYVFGDFFYLSAWQEVTIYLIKVVVGILFGKCITYFKSEKNINYAVSKIMKSIENDVFRAINKKTIEIVAKMLKDNVQIEKIAEYSGISAEEVEKIKKQNHLNLDDF